MVSTPKEQQKGSRARRLAVALRDNLKRRKAQAKARKPGHASQAGGAENWDGHAESHDSAGFTEHKKSGLP